MEIINTRFAPFNGTFWFKELILGAADTMWEYTLMGFQTIEGHRAHTLTNIVTARDGIAKPIWKPWILGEQCYSAIICYIP